MTNATSSPFPGMNPYLEHPALWPDVHNRLIAATANELAPVVRPHYYVAIEERVYLSSPEKAFTGRPDVTIVDSATDESPWPRVEEAQAAYRPILVNLPIPTSDEVRETYLEIRETAGGQVITVIELLSPANKQPGSEGYVQYLNKRLTVLRSQTHLVEIDLLRIYQPLPTEGNPPHSDYRIIVSRHWQRPQAHLYAFNLPDPIPDCLIPLKNQQEEEVKLDLQTLLNRLHIQAGYDLRIDYRAEPVPPLSSPNTNWVDNLLRQTGLRI